MHRQVANEVSVLVYYLQLLTCVIVVYTNLCVIGANNDPLFSCDKLSTSYGSICNFKGSHLGLLIVIKYDHCPSV
jgi:hypothetical protein